MSAEKCGNPIAYVLTPPEVIDTETNGLALSEKGIALLRKIRQKEPNWSPDTIKGLWNKAYRLGLLDEQN